MGDALTRVIEPLQKKTLFEFANLMRHYFEELNISPEFHRHDQDVTAPLSAYCGPRGGIWLGRYASQGKALGVAAVRPLAHRSCELKRLYILPEERRKGWGQFLLNHILQFARAAEYMELLLAIRPEQQVALRLCEKNGFKPCARYSEDRRAGIFYSFNFSPGVK